MTTTKRTILPLLLVAFSSLTFANTVSDAEIKKALEGITTIQIMKASEPKIISEIIVTDKQESSVQKTTKKVTKKRYVKKKVLKKRVKKRIIKKKTKSIEVEELKDVETLGVISTSKPFELK